MTRGSGWKRPAALIVVAIAGLLATASPAAADVVPFVDCVGAGPGTVNVYFGYANDGESASIGFGEENQVVPGIGYQGQPTIFNRGTYQRVFRAVWNQEAFQGIAWVLNGHMAYATRTGPNPSPTCIAGATGPASDLTPTTARLSAVVGVAGQKTSYHFEYGTGASLDLSTPVATLDEGQHSFVTEELTGLTPGTAYRYRVVATDEDGTTRGELGTFTTPVLPVPTPGPPTTPPGTGATTGGPAAATPAAGAPPAAEPFAISARAATSASISRRKACPGRVAAGLVITSNRPGMASISAKAGPLTVATRRVTLVAGPNPVTLCLNKAGRSHLTTTGHPRPLRALTVISAQAGTESARASLRLSFTRGNG